MRPSEPHTAQPQPKEREQFASWLYSATSEMPSQQWKKVRRAIQRVVDDDMPDDSEEVCPAVFRVCRGP